MRQALLVMQLIALVSLMFAAGPVGACSLHQAPSQTHAKASNTTYWAGPALSGAWYDPERSGEGVIVQILPDGRAIAVWFTYPAAGEPGEQAWLISSEGELSGNSIHFRTVFRPQGARFGAAFDPAAVRYEPWGEMRMRAIDCQTVEFSYVGPAAYGSASRRLSRLTAARELECSGQRELTPSGARAAGGLSSRSGSWYDTARPGQGWLLEELGQDQAVLYWFTFSPSGEQAWMSALGRRSGAGFVFDELTITEGTRFGVDFSAADVQRRNIGRVQIEPGTCAAMQLQYQLDDPQWGSATQTASRLTTLAGAPCLDSLPGPASALRWEERARQTNTPQSELAVTELGGQIYALGGFGSPRGVRRFDPMRNQWSQLAPLPGGRDHAAAFSLGGKLYLVGGAYLGGGDSSSTAFRYDPVGDRWESVQSLASSFGSSAVVALGFAWIGDADGSLQQFDHRANVSRRIVPPDATPRDHSRVVAFMDEIWVISGRSPETRAVAIYDPSSERWRDGPPIQRARGGFGAAVVGNRIVISGGEVIGSGVFIEPSTEVIGAGDNAWAFGPASPAPVHGTGAVALDGRYFLIGGSNRAGLATGATGRNFELLGLQP